MCRHLTKEQRLHIVLSTSELIEELEYEAKENQGKRTDLTSGPNGPKVEIESKVTNAELGKIAGVSKSTVTRAKKVNRICK